MNSIISRKVTITGFDFSSWRQCMIKWNHAIETMHNQCKEIGSDQCMMVSFVVCCGRKITVAYPPNYRLHTHTQCAWSVIRVIDIGSIASNAGGWWGGLVVVAGWLGFHVTLCVCHTGQPVQPADIHRLFVCGFRIHVVCVCACDGYIVLGCKHNNCASGRHIDK